MKLQDSKQAIQLLGGLKMRTQLKFQCGNTVLDYTKKSMSGKSKSETWKYIVRTLWLLRLSVGINFIHD